MCLITNLKFWYSFLKTFGQKIFFLLLALLFLQIPLVRSQTNEKVLAKVGKKEITVRDFLQRSGLTIRPNNFKNKNITLNNLISEKILALEAEQTGKLVDPVIEYQLKGIKEQLMRDKLFYQEASDKVELDSNEIRNAYRLSMREYELEFYTINDDSLKLKIDDILELAPELTGEIFKGLEERVGKKPIHKIKYLDPDDDIIHEAFFTTLLDTTDVIGPIKITNGDYIFARVVNWIDYPIVGEVDQQIRWNKVKEKMHQIRAGKLWRSFIASVMKGKKIEFNRESFKVLSDLAYDYYLRNKNNDSLNIRIAEIPLPGVEVDLDSPFFTIDNAVWTINDFKKELKSHPLVYRTKYLTAGNFSQQFKLAIVDMVRDRYLTQEAYQRSLNNSQDINKIVETWKDAYLAVDYMKSISNSALEDGIVDKDDYPGRTKYWETYLSNLQEKYSSTIWINHSELNKISLKNDIDFIALRPGVPYPVPVPKFPTLIPSGNLDYVRK